MISNGGPALESWGRICFLHGEELMEKNPIDGEESNSSRISYGKAADKMSLVYYNTAVVPVVNAIQLMEKNPIDGEESN